MATHTPVLSEVFVVAHSHSLKQTRAVDGQVWFAVDHSTY
jgi:hypothetical protein